ncbi:MAG TPA: hypothetical protein VJ934_08415, partial [Desulfomicrobiaceae bacterium]|nr:hypothetical protein [Desulfomicrobiaceae bacterium]
MPVEKRFGPCLRDAVVLVAAFVLVFFSGSMSWAGPEASVACPTRVELGKPFAVRLTSDEPLSEMRISWLG